MDDLEQAAREACRYTWERELSGKNLDGFVEIHWKEHLPGIRRMTAPFRATISRLTAERAKMVIALNDARAELHSMWHSHMSSAEFLAHPTIRLIDAALATPTVTDAEQGGGR
jgi:hypothetical protein